MAIKSKNVVFIRYFAGFVPYRSKNAVFTRIFNLELSSEGIYPIKKPPVTVLKKPCRRRVKKVGIYFKLPVSYDFVFHL
jgi:hypothetical protein